MKWVLLLFLSASLAGGQTNAPHFTNDQAGPSALPGQTGNQTHAELSMIQRAERMRTACIHERRRICGRILQILPDGLVIESGYTNLLRAPLTRSWLVPGTVTASRAANLVEGQEPDAVCVGLVILADVPKSRRLKPKVADYVILEGYPAGQETYVSVGTVQRSVRRFSAVLQRAVDWNLARNAAAAEGK